MNTDKINWVLVYKNSKYAYYRTNSLVLFTLDDRTVSLVSCVVNPDKEILQIVVSYPGENGSILDQMISRPHLRRDLVDYPKELQEGVLK